MGPLQRYPITLLGSDLRSALTPFTAAIYFSTPVFPLENAIPST